MLSVKRGRRYLGKDLALEHETSAIVKSIIYGDANGS